MWDSISGCSGLGDSSVVDCGTGVGGVVTEVCVHNSLASPSSSG